MEAKQVLVLEPSTNTHKLEAKSVTSKKLDEMNGLVLQIEGEGQVLHGEHGVIVTEAKNIIKLNQQESNPLTGMLENAYD